MIEVVKDVGPTIDYLETLPDFFDSIQTLTINGK